MGVYCFHYFTTWAGGGRWGGAGISAETSEGGMAPAVLNASDAAGRSQPWTSSSSRPLAGAKLYWVRMCNAARLNLVEVWNRSALQK